jgi:hypothetical protein
MKNTRISLAERLSKNKLFQFLCVAFFYAAVILLISYRVLPVDSAVNFNDSSFLWNFNDNAESVLSTWHPMYVGHDYTTMVFSQTKNFLMYGVLSSFVADQNILSYLVVFLPFFLCLMVANIVLRKTTKDYFLSLLLPLFLIFNNFTIENMFYGITAYVMWGYVSAILIIYFCHEIHKKKHIDSGDMAKLAFSTVLSFHPFFFVADILFIAGFFVFFAFSTPRMFFKKAIYFSILVLLLNSFWLIPFVQSTLSVDNNALHGQENNSNVFEAYNQVSTYVNSFSFITMFNDIGTRLYFGDVQYVYYFLLLAGLVFALFKLRKDRFACFLALAVLACIDLSMGPKGLVTGSGFTYLWDHYSFFSFFRSFKRFFVFVPVLYVFIAALFLMKARFKRVTILFLTLITLSVHYPLLTGNLSNIITSFKIPNEYVELNAYLKEDREYSNVLVFPFNHYERYSWANNRNSIEPMNYYWLPYYLNKPPILGGDATYLIHHSGILSEIDEKIMADEPAGDLLDALGAKYILVSKDAIDENWEKIEHEDYEEYFKKFDFNMVKDNQYFSIYENKSFKPLLAVDGMPVNYDYVRPTKINFELKNIQGTVDVDFLQNYSEGWKLYVNEERGEKTIFAREEVGGHSLYLDYANKWMLDVDYIRKHYPDSYTLNQDGTANVALSLSFVNQDYYYLGMVLSLASFAVVLLTFGGLFARRHKTS